MKVYLAKVSSVKVYIVKYVNSLLGTVVGNHLNKKLLFHCKKSVHKTIQVCGLYLSWIVLQETVLLLKLQSNPIRKSSIILFLSTQPN